MKLKNIWSIFFIIAIGMFIVLIFALISVYFRGFGNDHYTGSTIEIVPKVYGIEAVEYYIKWNFSLSACGILWVPIYTISLLYIIIYMLKKHGHIKYKRRENE